MPFCSLPYSNILAWQYFILIKSNTQLLHICTHEVQHEETLTVLLVGLHLNSFQKFRCESLVLPGKHQVTFQPIHSASLSYDYFLSSLTVISSSNLIFHWWSCLIFHKATERAVGAGRAQVPPPPPPAPACTPSHSAFHGFTCLGLLTLGSFSLELSQHLHACCSHPFSSFWKPSIWQLPGIQFQLRPPAQISTLSAHWHESISTEAQLLIWYHGLLS